MIAVPDRGWEIHEPDPVIIRAVLHLNAGHDRSGNPRRLWVGIAADGTVVRVEDEGYESQPDWVRELAAAGTYPVSLQIPAAEYRRLLALPLPTYC